MLPARPYVVAPSLGAMALVSGPGTDADGDRVARVEVTGRDVANRHLARRRRRRRWSDAQVMTGIGVVNGTKRRGGCHLPHVAVLSQGRDASPAARHRLPGREIRLADAVDRHAAIIDDNDAGQVDRAGIGHHVTPGHGAPDDDARTGCVVCVFPIG